jgi:hypothetical protein
VYAAVRRVAAAVALARLRRPGYPLSANDYLKRLGIGHGLAVHVEVVSDSRRMIVQEGEPALC